MEQGRFMEDINDVQNSMENDLCIVDDGNTVYTRNGKPLSNGCQCCKSGTWMCIYLGYQCNAKCKYCAQGSIYEKGAIQEDSTSTQNMLIDKLKETILGQRDKIHGISYTGGEPLMYMEKLIELMEFVKSNDLQVYQWMYTNGMLITEDKLITLKELGLNEIRFHWGATDFSDEVFEKMKLAKKYIEHVNIETPATIAAVRHLVAHRKIKMLEEIGIEQINLGEVALTCDFNMYHMGKGMNYRYEGEHFKSASPIDSRHATYDIMKYAIANTPGIIINDCSNQAKDWQQKKAKENNIIFFG
jgi:pyruvate formate-lyase activating enzyme-like uncharacterized protein